MTAPAPMTRWSRSSAAPASSAGTWCARWPSATIASASRCAGPTSPATCSRSAGSARSMPCRPMCATLPSVEAAARDAHVVINLVGILFERGRQRFDAVQAYGAEQVALAANAHGARMIHVSAIGADENSTSAYARAKAEASKRCWRPALDRDHAALDRVRAGGRFLQQVCRDGANVAGAAADRRRAYPIPAGVRRRRRRGDRRCGRRQGARRRDLRTRRPRGACLQGTDGIRARNDRAQPASHAAAVPARQIAGDASCNICRSRC